MTNNSSHSTLHIDYKDNYIEQTANTTFLGLETNYIEQTANTKFLGLETDNRINLKSHIELMIPKLSAACYVVRLTVHISNSNSNSNSNTPKSIYYAYFHSIIKYGIVF